MFLHIMTPQMAYFWTNDESANSNFLSNVTHRNSLDAEIPYRTLSEVTYNYIIDINTFKPLTIFRIAYSEIIEEIILQWKSSYVP